MITEKSYSPKQSPKSRKYKRKVNMKQTKQPAQCVGCSPVRTFPSEKVALEHMKEAHYNKNKCMLCEKEIKWSTIMTHFRQTHVVSPYECYACGKVLSNWIKYYSHLYDSQDSVHQNSSAKKESESPNIIATRKNSPGKGKSPSSVKTIT